MQIRRRVLLMTDLLVLLHFITIPAIVILQPDNVYSFERNVFIPFIIFPLLGCFAVMLAILLYVAAFKLSSRCIIIWSVFMIIMWQVLIGLLIIHYFFEDNHNADTIPESNHVYTFTGRIHYRRNSTHRNNKRIIERLDVEVLLILWVWLFFWLMVMFEAYRFYINLVRFRDNPRVYNQSEQLSMIRVLSEAFMNVDAYQVRGAVLSGENMDAIKKNADDGMCQDCNLPVKVIILDEPQ